MPAVLYAVSDLKFPWDDPEEYARNVVNNVGAGIPIANAFLNAGTTALGYYSRKTRGRKASMQQYQWQWDKMIPTPFQGVKELASGVFELNPKKFGTGSAEVMGVPGVSPARTIIRIWCWLLCWSLQAISMSLLSIPSSSHLKMATKGRTVSNKPSNDGSIAMPSDLSLGV